MAWTLPQISLLYSAMKPDQAPPPPKPPLTVQLQRVWQLLQDTLRDILHKLRDVAGNNLKLAEYHLEKGNYRDAILRFRMVLWMNPKHKEALFGLAKAYAILQENDNAVATLKRLFRLDPAHAGGRALMEYIKNPPPPEPEPAPDTAAAPANTVSEAQA